jgi:hypothetical protein
MFIYLGKSEVKSEYHYHIVDDTVSKKLYVVKEEDYDLLKVAVELGIMKAVCVTDENGDSLLLPYRKRYIELDKFVRETQVEIARMKVIGKELQHLDDTFYGISLPKVDGYTIRVGEDDSLWVDGGCVRYDFSSGKLYHCVCVNLKAWELVEIMNDYLDYCQQDVVFFDRTDKDTDYLSLGSQAAIMGYSGIYCLMRELFLAYYKKDFNIGFVKQGTDLYYTGERKVRVSHNNFVLKFLWKEEQYVLGKIGLTDSEKRLGKECTSEYIEWLPEQIRKKYFGEGWLEEER